MYVDLRQLAEASNGVYDTFIQNESVMKGIVVSMVAATVLAILFAIIAGTIGPAFSRNDSKLNVKAVLGRLLLTLSVLSTIWIIVGLFSWKFLTDQRQTGPSPADVFEAAYDVSIIKIEGEDSEDNSKYMTGYCFVLVDLENSPLLGKTMSVICETSNGEVLDSLVAIDSTGNMYAIDQDTHTLVEPVITDYSEICKKLSS